MYNAFTFTFISNKKPIRMRPTRDIKVKRDLIISEIEMNKAIIHERESCLRKNFEALREYDTVFIDIENASEILFERYQLQKISENEILQTIEKINRFCKNEEIIAHLYPYIKLTEEEFSNLKANVSSALNRLGKRKIIVRKGSFKFSEWGLASFLNQERRIVGILLND